MGSSEAFHEFVFSFAWFCWGSWDIYVCYKQKNVGSSETFQEGGFVFVSLVLSGVVGY